MRLRRTIVRGAGCLAAALALTIASTGCQAFKRAFRPARPAATAPPVEAEPAEVPEEPAPPPLEAAPAPEETAPVPPEAPATPPLEPAAPPRQEPAPPRPETPPAEPPARPAEKPPLPEIDAVSTPGDEQQPQLVAGSEQLPQSALEARLAEAERLSGVLRGRTLTADLRAQVDAGRAFLDDARAALEARDLKRTQVLLDKCLVLLGDAERATRP